MSAARIEAIAKSYMRDAQNMAHDPENFTRMEVVAYQTIANELRKVAAQVEQEARG